MNFARTRPGPSRSVQRTPTDRPTRAWIAALTIATLSVGGQATAQESGSVQIPLALYQQLTRGHESGPTPHAAGPASVTVDIGDDGSRASAEITAELVVETHGTEWTLVPLMPLGVAVQNATVDGAEVRLIPTATGLSWGTEGAGTHQVRIVYRVDGHRQGDGYSIPIPLPAAPSSTVTATIPGTGLHAALLPASAVQTRSAGASTVVEASVPAGSGTQLSWRAPASTAHTLSRAMYRGTLDGDAVRWTATFGVELPHDGPVTVPLLPRSVALATLTADGADAAIDLADARYAVTLRGRGRHSVTAEFQVPLVDEAGLPGVELAIPEVPVSHFELTLPGDKDVRVTPAAGVRVRRERGTTVASFHTSMTNAVSLRWPPAIPDDAGEQVDRANATIHHVVHAEEGVLQLRAITTFDVTHGGRSQLELALPADIHVNGVTGSGVSDWRVSDDVLVVFLDRELAGELTFEVAYEQALAMNEGIAERFDVPLLSARDVHRQRGMVALLASRELTISPEEEDELTRVGENQLPASVRDSIAMTVAHTYRYVDAAPALTAVTARREREQGRFDAQVDTLISLDDVTTTAEAVVDIHVKSGSLTGLELVLPEGVNFLDLSAPSLREHQLRTVGDEQHIAVNFTQDLEGQFRIEVRYERIGAERSDQAELTVPTLHVRGADVEQGRIAVEALAAVQVDPATTDRLSPLDVGELPQQLILRTTNPILHAYKYVQASPRPELALRITRHAEIATQDATIDEANYQTLVTRDGFSVTTARFLVRNQRKQFLRVTLPENAEVWSARVDGQPETPALEANDSDAPTVLINIINSADGFPVELVYATREAPIGVFGRVRGTLPTPEMVVTRTTWEVFLPADADYAAPRSDLTLREPGALVSDLPDLAEGSPNGLQVLVPAEGVRFTFEKLYAGQGGEAAEFSIPYASGWGSTLSTLLSLFGTALVWLAVVGLVMVRRRAIPRLPAGAVKLATYRDHGDGAPEVRFHRSVVPTLLASGLTGLVLLAVSLGYLATSPAAAASASAVIGTAVLSLALRDHLRQWTGKLRGSIGLKPASPTSNHAPNPPKGFSSGPRPVQAPDTDPSSSGTPNRDTGDATSGATSTSETAPTDDEPDLGDSEPRLDD